MIHSPPAFFDARALAEYVRCFTPKTIHGSCEDCRAAATIDLEHDEADHKADRRIAMPSFMLWETIEALEVRAVSRLAERSFLVSA